MTPFRLTLLVALAACFHPPEAVRAEVLTNAAAVLALPADQAIQELPVTVRGVVTAASKAWYGRFFVQDDSAGVFVDNISTEQPDAGDLVEVSGVSHPGAFAPVIAKPVWKKIGVAPLPTAKPITVDALACGVEDGQRIEINGFVRGVRRTKEDVLGIDLIYGRHRFEVYARLPPTYDDQALVGAFVRIRGTVAASFNADLRQLVNSIIYVPREEDLTVDQPAPNNPYEEAPLPLEQIAQYRPDGVPGKRVHVKGIVTYQRLSQDLFIHDGQRGLRVKGRDLPAFAPGEIVEAVGFPDLENFLPVLQDAVCRKTSEKPQTIRPRPATIEEVQSGLLHANLVTMRGRLIDRSTTPLRQQEAYTEKTVLMLQSSNFIFTAEEQEAKPNSMIRTVPLGSIIEVSGISLTEADEEGSLQSLQMLLPGGADIRIIQTPSWLTPQRLLIGLVALIALSMVGLAWTITVTKKNSALKLLIREREKAKAQLQQAHDLLEERVRERTAQLKFQITARKESELQFKAVLSERTRLAQELHDTLEQTLTGIALQLDTTSRLFQKNPAGATHHLELARTLMTQSQAEVRRSIWDLRCRALEQFDLPSALKTTGRQLTDGSTLELEVAARGEVRPLPERIEDNLLRLAQEALTNVVKHAAATHVSIELDYGPGSVSLTIKDNGKGFRPESCLGPQDGHFGLLGISERTKRLNGEISLTSTPGNGTSVRVIVPLGLGVESPRTESSAPGQLPADLTGPVSPQIEPVSTFSGNAGHV